MKLQRIASEALPRAEGLRSCHCERSEAISTSDKPQDCFVVPPRNDWQEDSRKTFQIRPFK
jgi:hypothetical protein